LSPRPSGLKPGLLWRAWNRSFDWVPDFSQMGSPGAMGRTAGVNVQVKPSLAQKGVELTGYLMVPKDGEYAFYLKTDAQEGSKAFVHLHEMQLIDADFNYSPGEEADSRAVQGVAEDVLEKAGPAALAAQTVKLKAGLHPIRIGYVGKTTSSSLSLQWESADAGLKKQDIPAKAFSCRYVKP
ncbi:PA14 domain-containing protein, partial [Akkermansia sp.]|uniref:PA14 domain-containing protein n=1 Tax=Akkermansia sp. TaxID=1872421 RepID=UPI0025C03BFA